MNPLALRALVPIAALAGLAACTTASPTPTAGATTTAPTSAAPTSGATPSASDTQPRPVRRPPPPRPLPGERRDPPAGVAAEQLAPDRPEAHQVRGSVSHRRRDRHRSRLAGDGVLLFKNTDGMWRKVAEGSALDCKAFGIPADIGDKVGCQDQ
ncbi:hypothetical protein NKG94_15245 [Micromonospora sp. M12]